MYSCTQNEAQTRHGRAGHEAADKANHRLPGLLEARLVLPFLRAVAGRGRPAASGYAATASTGPRRRYIRATYATGMTLLASAPIFTIYDGKVPESAGPCADRRDRGPSWAHD